MDDPRGSMTISFRTQRKQIPHQVAELLFGNLLAPVGRHRRERREVARLDPRLFVSLLLALIVREHDDGSLFTQQETANALTGLEHERCGAKRGIDIAV